MILVKDILNALDNISKGRCLKSPKDFSSYENAFVVTKTSNIPGKSVTELPGLICGNLDMEVKKVAVMMTLTENSIELAAASGVDAIIAHHPMADACNAGGVLLKDYLGLYNIAAFELHEAFHGLHPGIPWLHGHEVIYSNIAYGGIPGNVVYVGETYKGVDTLGDILNRLNYLMNLSYEDSVLNIVKQCHNYKNTVQSSLSLKGTILVGEYNSPVRKLIHIFPHTGFSPDHLQQLVNDFPDVDTVLASISRVYEPHPLIDKSRELGLNFICGNSHTLEILENGIPLAYALRYELPQLEVVIFREIVTSIPLDCCSTLHMRNYGKNIAKKYLK